MLYAYVESVAFAVVFKLLEIFRYCFDFSTFIACNAVINCA